MSEVAKSRIDEIRSARQYHVNSEWEDGPLDWAIDDLLEYIDQLEQKANEMKVLIERLGRIS